MNKYLIILDIDNTLIDHNYRSTSPTINSVIDQMKREGHVFVLNSNRSLEDILPVVKMFELGGKIIGENGCFIYDTLTAERDILVDDEIIMHLSQVKNILPQLVKQNFEDSFYIIEDTTEVNKNPDSLNLDPLLKNVFVENCFRNFSSSIHVREHFNGSLQENIPALRKISGLLNQYVTRQNLELVVSCCDSFCNLLIYPKNYDKGKAFDKLASYYPEYKKIVIADDVLDKPLLGKVDKFCVVNNATAEVRELADYVSPEKITKGVEEILLNLDKII
ncbi:MAG: hypothetical protein UT91_C0011G0034 [Parcubacteria group bacterium GW2011_GWA2_40_23]|nr:MAG: hypothetical protein UT91_C0011G0034 [Parcubacteria group bacterium GW2011_GWA2_40_23]